MMTVVFRAVCSLANTTAIMEAWARFSHTNLELLKPTYNSTANKLNLKASMPIVGQVPLLYQAQHFKYFISILHFHLHPFPALKVGPQV